MRSKRWAKKAFLAAGILGLGAAGARGIADRTIPHFSTSRPVANFEPTRKKIARDILEIGQKLNENSAKSAESLSPGEKLLRARSGSLSRIYPRTGLLLRISRAAGEKQINKLLDVLLGAAVRIQPKGNRENVLDQIYDFEGDLSENPYLTNEEKGRILNVVREMPTEILDYVEKEVAVFDQKAEIENQKYAAKADEHNKYRSRKLNQWTIAGLLVSSAILLGVKGIKRRNARIRVERLIRSIDE